MADTKSSSLSIFTKSLLSISRFLKESTGNYGRLTFSIKSFSTGNLVFNTSDNFFKSDGGLKILFVYPLNVALIHFVMSYTSCSNGFLITPQSTTANSFLPFSFLCYLKRFFLFLVGPSAADVP